jgi:hypothetical protein
VLVHALTTQRLDDANTSIDPKLHSR